VFLWPERSWLRKGVEAGFTGLVELVWGKRRIIEVYLNVAEFDEGVFGVEAAARRYFGVSAPRRCAEPGGAADGGAARAEGPLAGVGHAVHPDAGGRDRARRRDDPGRRAGGVFSLRIAGRAG
jgi:hypothetical protein